MREWNFIVNNEVVDTIDQQGRTKEALYWIILDKVYELTQQYRSSVGVYSRSGAEYSYV